MFEKQSLTCVYEDLPPSCVRFGVLECDGNLPTGDNDCICASFCNFATALGGTPSKSTFRQCQRDFLQ